MAADFQVVYCPGGLERRENGAGIRTRAGIAG